MGLNIYFLEKDGSDIEIESHLQITHNLNTVLIEMGTEVLSGCINSCVTI